MPKQNFLTGRFWEYLAHWLSNVFVHHVTAFEIIREELEMLQYARAFVLENVTGSNPIFLRLTFTVKCERICDRILWSYLKKRLQQHLPSTAVLRFSMDLSVIRAAPVESEIGEPFYFEDSDLWGVY